MWEPHHMHSGFGSRTSWGVHSFGSSRLVKTDMHMSPWIGDCNWMAWKGLRLIVWFFKHEPKWYGILWQCSDTVVEFEHLLCSRHPSRNKFARVLVLSPRNSVSKASQEHPCATAVLLMATKRLHGICISDEFVPGVTAQVITCRL
jgi:hypothetical protein